MYNHYTSATQEDTECFRKVGTAVLYDTKFDRYLQAALTCHAEVLLDACLTRAQWHERAVLNEGGTKTAKLLCTAVGSQSP